VFLLAGLALYGLSANAATPEDAESSLAPGTSESTSAQLKPIDVIGTRIPTAAAESMFDLRIYDRQRIDDSGQTTVTDFLATLPEVSLNSVESTNLATTVRLRGAVRGSPLVLINGRRSLAERAYTRLTDVCQPVVMIHVGRQTNIER